MGAGATAKRRRTGTDTSANSATPSRSKPSSTGRGRGRPPNAPRDGRERPPPLAECFRKRCGDMLDRLSKKDHYNIFLEPVNVEDVAGYAETIKRPMDFTTMRTKLAQQAYKSLGEFRKDLDLIWANCLLFNGEEPTNVFSKKAVELSRLTEKLIVTTRQHLEKDKENLLKWKEKHRRRKEAMQANAAVTGPVLHGASIGAPSSVLASRDPHGQIAANVNRDVINTSADEVEAEDNGRTPEQNALAESLRLQYAGTSGIFKKSARNTPLPHYTKPDGSIVQIPLVSYSPGNDNWGTGDSECVQSYSLDSVPDFLCESLQPRRKRRRCRPEPNMQSVLVGDYVNSLNGFVKGAGHISSKVVEELLSPELAIKRQQDELRKQGLDIRKLPAKASSSSGPGTEAALPTREWDADAIVKLANDIERANARTVSLLPKLERSIKELDGINGLRELVGDEIAQEIDDVPVEVVDFAMPHGVSLSTMAEICRFRNAPALQLSENDWRCVEQLRKTAQDFLSQIGPEAAAKMTGASVLTPAQLHDIQLRALAMRRHRRLEAEKQAAYIKERTRGAGSKQVDALEEQRKRDVDVGVQNLERARVSTTRAPTTIVPNATSAQRRNFDQAAKIKAKSQAALELMQGSGMVPAQPAGNAGRAASRTTPHKAQRTVNSLPPATKDSVCKICGTKDTLGWRAGGIDANGVERLCIQCGLYWEKTNRHRPREMWNQAGQRKPRSASGSPAPNGRAPVQVGVNTTSSVTPNGVAKRPIQKTSRASPSCSRRSPPSGGSHGKASKPRLPPAVVVSNHVPLAAHGMQGVGVHSNGMQASNARPIAPQMHLATQAFPAHGNQRTSLETNNFLAQHAIQNLQNVHPSNAAPFNGNVAMTGPQVNVQQQPLPLGAPTMMYGEQRAPNAVVSSQQSITAAPTATAQSFMSLAKGSYIHKAQSQHVMASSIAAPTQLSTSFAQQVHEQKNGAMVVNSNGGLQQHGMQGRGAVNMIQPVSMKDPQLLMKQNGTFGSEQRQQLPVADGVVMSGALGAAGIPAFISQASANSSLAPSFGESDGRTPFVGGGADNGDGVATDQIVENIFFDEGALEATAGPPEFDF